MNPNIQEAQRHIDNAKAILSEKAKKQNGFYTDRKYVKMAGHAAYTGMLLALDGVFGKKGKGRKDIDWYKENTAKWNKKLLPALNSAYDILHLSMGYDGVLDVRVSSAGIDTAEKIIEKAAEA